MIKGATAATEGEKLMAAARSAVALDRSSQTARGFTFYERLDHYGERYSIQDSSLAVEECIWLGVEPVKIKIKGWHPEYPERARDLTEEEGKNLIAFGRMHLTRAMAAELIALLEHFVETGSLP